MSLLSKLFSGPKSADQPKAVVTVNKPVVTKVVSPNRTISKMDVEKESNPTVAVAGAKNATSLEKKKKVKKKVVGTSNVAGIKRLFKSLCEGNEGGVPAVRRNVVEFLSELQTHFANKSIGSEILIAETETRMDLGKKKLTINEKSVRTIVNKHYINGLQTIKARLLLENVGDVAPMEEFVAKSEKQWQEYVSFVTDAVNSWNEWSKNSAEEKKNRGESLVPAEKKKPTGASKKAGLHINVSSVIKTFKMQQGNQFRIKNNAKVLFAASVEWCLQQVLTRLIADAGSSRIHQESLQNAMDSLREDNAVISSMLHAVYLPYNVQKRVLRNAGGKKVVIAKEDEEDDEDMNDIAEDEEDDIEEEDDEVVDAPPAKKNTKKRSADENGEDEAIAKKQLSPSKKAKKTDKK